MFSGVIEEVGIVESVGLTRSGRRISIRSAIVAAEVGGGESVAVNGVCVTVVGSAPPESLPAGGRLVADILQRTWEVTNLSLLRPGSAVNLEGALRVGDRLGGHFVLGHVDGQGIVRSLRREGSDMVMGISVSSGLGKGLVPRGSVAVDGVSLTIARLAGNLFYVHLIPYTLSHTTLGGNRAGDRVNIELDVLGKYVNRQRGEAISKKFLRDAGFL